YVLEEGDYELKVQTDSHQLAEGLEPIVYTVPETVTYTDGRASDEAPATNQFDDSTAKFTDGAATPFSRADFEGTFPTAPTAEDLVADDETVAAFEPYDAEAAAAAHTDVEEPTWGASTDLSLIDLRGLPYDDVEWDAMLVSTVLRSYMRSITSGT